MKLFTVTPDFYETKMEKEILDGLVIDPISLRDGVVIHKLKDNKKDIYVAKDLQQNDGYMSPYLITEECSIITTKEKQTNLLIPNKTDDKTAYIYFPDGVMEISKIENDFDKICPNGGGRYISDFEVAKEGNKNVCAICGELCIPYNQLTAPRLPAPDEKLPIPIRGAFHYYHKDTKSHSKLARVYMKNRLETYYTELKIGDTMVVSNSNFVNFVVLTYGNKGMHIKKLDFGGARMLELIDTAPNPFNDDIKENVFGHRHI